jgi:hypothetical protein
MNLPLFSGSDDTHDLGVGGQLPFDPRFTAHALHLRADAQRGDFQDQRVARNNGTSKTRFFDAGKQNQFLISIFDFAQRQYGADLGQRLDYEHPGHNGRPRKVALKKQFVNADLFYANDSFAGNKLYDAIDEKERIAMRQKLLDRL